jgi:hypothetical protein
MTRDVRWYLVGSLVLLTLAGCARNFMAQREPWRREAEVQCIKGGSVKQGPAVALLSPIDGPGTCGADFPMKVAALGETQTLGYADDPVRPPGGIPQGPQGTQSAPPGRILGSPPGYLRVPSGPPPATPPSGGYGGEAGGPTPLTPPGIAPPPPDSPGTYAPPMPSYGAAAAPPRSRSPVGRGPLPPVRESAPARSGPGSVDYEEPGFSPNPIDRASPFREQPRASRPAPPPVAPPRTTRDSAPARESPRDTASIYPPSYPSMGEPVPVGPSRPEPLTTGATAAAVSPAATLACPLVSALDRWVLEGVQPAAQRWFRQPVVEIKQISAYSCRGMNGNPRARISEHAFGNALDIAGFVLADGHVITVKRGWRGTPEEQGFLHDVQTVACELFTTVLAPGSNVFHYDHIHVDLMRRDSGRRICQPAAIPGDVVAARARSGSGYAAQRPDFGATGSIAARRRAARGPDSRFDEDRDLPRAVPGED